MRFCKNCEFYYDVYMTCLYPIDNEVHDPISGDRYRCAIGLREARYRECYCGSEAKWYKEKK